MELRRKPSFLFFPHRPSVGRSFTEMGPEELQRQLDRYQQEYCHLPQCLHCGVLLRNAVGCGEIKILRKYTTQRSVKKPVKKELEERLQKNKS